MKVTKRKLLMIWWLFALALSLVWAVGCIVVACLASAGAWSTYLAEGHQGAMVYWGAAKALLATLLFALMAVIVGGAPVVGAGFLAHDDLILPPKN